MNICRISYRVAVQCYFVVPPAQIKLFLTIPVSLHPTTARDAWFQTLILVCVYCVAPWRRFLWHKLILFFSPPGQQLLDDYPRCFIVGADNVGSKQMQQIRLSLRGKAVVLMGKNTMMRKAIRGHLENNPALER